VYVGDCIGAGRLVKGGGSESRCHGSQTLRDWVHRYNAGALDDCSTSRGLMALPRLSTGQLAKITEWVEQGPDFQQYCVALRPPKAVIQAHRAPAVSNT
jgi:hypothetical protein